MVKGGRQINEKRMKIEDFLTQKDNIRAIGKGKKGIPCSELCVYHLKVIFMVGFSSKLQNENEIPKKLIITHVFLLAP